MYLKYGVTMTRARQALILEYHEKRRALKYRCMGDNEWWDHTGMVMSLDQFERYQEWINAFLVPQSKSRD